MSKMQDTGDTLPLEIRPLSETPEAVARFISDVYDTHDHGSSFVPRWTGDFLAKAVFDFPGRAGDHTLGAYLGDRLAGVLLSHPHAVDFGGRRLQGAYASWLAVTHEGARQFAALALVSELRQRLAARGAHFIVGTTYRSGPGSGLDFWQAFAKACPDDVQVGPKLKFWLRVTDSRALAGAARSGLIRLGAQLARRGLPSNPDATQHVRRAEPRDIEQCQSLFAASIAEAKSMPVAYELSIARDAGDGPETLVVDCGRGVEAVATYYILPMEDAAPLRIGMIDHLLGRPGGKGVRLLVDELTWRLRNKGVCLALLPRAPDIKYRHLVRSHFLPYPESFQWIYMRLTSAAPERLPRSFQLPVR